MHAEQAEAGPHKQTIKRINQRIALLNKQDKEVQAELAALIKDDPRTCNSMLVILCSIPGVGLLTAAIVLARNEWF